MGSRRIIGPPILQTPSSRTSFLISKRRSQGRRSSTEDFQSLVSGELFLRCSKTTATLPISVAVRHPYLICTPIVDGASELLSMQTDSKINLLCFPKFQSLYYTQVLLQHFSVHPNFHYFAEQEVDNRPNIGFYGFCRCRYIGLQTHVEKFAPENRPV